MTDFYEKGFECVDLIDAKFVFNFWNDLDKKEIERLRNELPDVLGWMPMRFPITRAYLDFLEEVHKVRNDLYPLSRSPQY